MHIQYAWVILGPFYASPIITVDTRTPNLSRTLKRLFETLERACKRTTKCSSQRFRWRDLVQSLFVRPRNDFFLAGTPMGKAKGTPKSIPREATRTPKPLPYDICLITLTFGSIWSLPEHALKSISVILSKVLYGSLS